MTLKGRPFEKFMATIEVSLNLCQI